MELPYRLRSAGLLGVGGFCLGQDGGYHRLDHRDLYTGRDLDGDLICVIGPDGGDFSDQSPGGHDLVAALQRVDHRAVFLQPLLLRADQQEVHDDEDQDERQQAGDGAGSGGAGGLGVGGGDEHGASLSGLARAPCTGPSYRGLYRRYRGRSQG